MSRIKLRSKITWIFSLFALFLSLVFFSVMWISMFSTEDLLLATQLDVETQHFMDSHGKARSAGQVKLPNKRFFKGYLGQESLPAFLQKDLAPFKAGSQEVFQGEGAGKHYHVAIRDMDYLPQKFFMVYEVSEFLAVRKLRPGIILAMYVLTGITVALGLLIALYTTKIVFNPLHKLIQLVQEMEPAKVPTSMSTSFKDPEIVILTETLDQAFSRIQSFIDREKEFSRSVSHELRTPITVMKGALELIEQTSDALPTPVQSSLKRLSRATLDMEMNIEAFLWLGREKSKTIEIEKCNALSAIEKAIQQYEHMLKRKPLRINIDVQATPLLMMPEPVFLVLVGNLIKNSIQHTMEGEILIQLFPEKIVITDSGEGIDADQLDSVLKAGVKGKDSLGFGLGLSIVHRICEHFDWQLELKPSKKNGTQATLFF